MRRVMDEIGEQISDRELAEIIKVADLDNDGKITFQEFTNVLR